MPNMTPTLDTAAIRKRFEAAVIGIRADGTMAVLVPSLNGIYFDLVSGYRYSDLSTFRPVIRAGDRVEVSDDLADDWHPAVFRGIGTIATGINDMYPFAAVMDDDGDELDNYVFIRPLPAAETATCPKCGDEMVKYADLVTDEVTLECPTCRRKENELNRRLAAAEQELAAIRAEMEGSSK